MGGGTVTSRVYAALLGGKVDVSQPERVRRLLRRVGLAGVVTARDIVAVKVHWGERENTATCARSSCARWWTPSARRAGAPS